MDSLRLQNYVNYKKKISSGQRLKINFEQWFYDKTYLMSTTKCVNRQDYNHMVYIR